MMKRKVLGLRRMGREREMIVGSLKIPHFLRLLMVRVTVRIRIRVTDSITVLKLNIYFILDPNPNPVEGRLNRNSGYDRRESRSSTDQEDEEEG
jgi:hypothetical protein